MLISERMLSRHLDWLAARFELMPLDDLAASAQGAPAGRKPPAAVTFDDGYADFFDYAYPLLRRKGIPATIFVVTDLVGTKRLQSHDRLFLALERSMKAPRFRPQDLERLLLRLGLQVEEAAALRSRLRRAVDATPALLERMPHSGIERLIEELGSAGRMDRKALAPYEPLDWSMIIEMSRSGVTIGSHTASHALLSNEDFTTARREALDSRVALERKIETKVRHFAYPAGRFDPVAVAAVADAGYAFAYTTCRHRDPAHPHLTIPRTVFWERTSLDLFDRFSPAMMSCQVHGVFDRRRACTHERRDRRRADLPTVSHRLGAES